MFKTINTKQSTLDNAPAVEFTVVTVSADMVLPAKAPAAIKPGFDPAELVNFKMGA